jgi:Aminotransferase class I and II
MDGLARLPVRRGTNAASDLLLNRHSIYIQPINYPTVSIGTERLRITSTPRHNEAHVSCLVEALVDVWKLLELPFITSQSSCCAGASRCPNVFIPRSIIDDVLKPAP